MHELIRDVVRFLLTEYIHPNGDYNILVAYKKMHKRIINSRMNKTNKKIAMRDFNIAFHTFIAREVSIFQAATFTHKVPSTKAICRHLLQLYSVETIYRKN